MAGPFRKGFLKTAKAAGFFQNPKKLGYTGLGMLAVPAAVHAAKEVKEERKKGKSGAGAAAMGGLELGGLGVLAREVAKAH